MMLVEVECNWCGSKLTRYPSDVRGRTFCSRVCYYNFKRGCEPIIKKCANCGKEIEVTKSRLRGNNNFFCNWNCMIKFRRRDLPEEEIIRRYIDGESLSEIASDYDVRFQAIARLLERNGIERRKRGGRAKDVKFERKENLAYILGVILGDGCIIHPRSSSRQYGVRLNVTSKTFAKKFAKHLEKVGLNPTWMELDSKGSHFFTVEATSKKLVNWLDTFDSQMIIDFANSSVDTKKRFLQGLYDSDGKTDRSWIGNTNKELIDIVEELLDDEDFKIKRKTTKTQSGRNYFTISISPNSFKDWIGGTIKS